MLESRAWSRQLKTGSQVRWPGKARALPSLSCLSVSGPRPWPLTVGPPSGQRGEDCPLAEGMRSLEPGTGGAAPPGSISTPVRWAWRAGTPRAQGTPGAPGPPPRPPAWSWAAGEACPLCALVQVSPPGERDGKGLGRQEAPGKPHSSAPFTTVPPPRREAEVKRRASWQDPNAQVRAHLQAAFVIMAQLPGALDRGRRELREPQWPCARREGKWTQLPRGPIHLLGPWTQFAGCGRASCFRC